MTCLSSRASNVAGHPLSAQWAAWVLLPHQSGASLLRGRQNLSGPLQLLHKTKNKACSRLLLRQKANIAP